MSKAKVKKYLLSLSKEQVVNKVLDLYGASKEANAWMEFYLEPNCDAELEKYKITIRSQFFGRNGCPQVSGNATNSSQYFNKSLVISAKEAIRMQESTLNRQIANFALAS